MQKTRFDRFLSLITGSFVPVKNKSLIRAAGMQVLFVDASFGSSHGFQFARHFLQFLRLEPLCRLGIKRAAVE
jgi:hypothetical protein